MYVMSVALMQRGTNAIALVVERITARHGRNAESPSASLVRFTLSNYAEVFGGFMSMKTLIAAAGMAVLLSGCAAGYEIGGKIGGYRVDERHESAQSFREDNKSLKCWLFDCPKVQTAEAAHGS